ncbi:EamA family transporter RarD [Brevundimonas sp.]|uniref:EamA family transporter RarD n=1 Tax=Brevundimonas sp. TaxID=1871086 RepID=UPI0037C152A0
MTSPALSADKRAVATAIACYGLWGFMPLLFMAMNGVGFTAPEILAHRALWSVLFAGGLVILAGQVGQARRVLLTPRILGWLALSTAMIAINWGIYVWATTTHHTLEASLGYYINPLLNMAAGMVLFREKIDRWGWAAIGLAVVGVILQTVALGRPPWLSLILALSFAAYGVIRKRVPADAQTGLFVECLLLLPFGAAFLIWASQMGQTVGFDDPVHWLWAISSGPATVLPLALFAWSARRLPLSTIGFVQFLAPTLQFAIGVASGEPMTALRALSFVFIWAGAGVFALGAVFRSRAARRAVAASEPA